MMSLTSALPQYQRPQASTLTIPRAVSVLRSHASPALMSFNCRCCGLVCVCERAVPRTTTPTAASRGRGEHGLPEMRYPVVGHLPDLAPQRGCINRGVGTRGAGTGLKVGAVGRRNPAGRRGTARASGLILPIAMHEVRVAFGTVPGGHARRVPGTSVEVGGTQSPSTRRMPRGQALGSGPPGIAGLASRGGRQAWGCFGSMPARQSRGTHLGCGGFVSHWPVRGSLSGSLGKLEHLQIGAGRALLAVAEAVLWTDRSSRPGTSSPGRPCTCPPRPDPLSIRRVSRSWWCPVPALRRLCDGIQRWLRRDRPDLLLRGARLFLLWRNGRHRPKLLLLLLRRTRGPDDLPR